MNQPKPTVFNYNDYLKLQAENADLKQQLAAKEKSLKGSMSLNGEATDRIETLIAKLAASQRREQAAVDDIERVLADTDYTEFCYLCANCAKRCPEEAECKPKWRGPQEAGKGEADERSLQH